MKLALSCCRVEERPVDLRSNAAATGYINFILHGRGPNMEKLEGNKPAKCAIVPAHATQAHAELIQHKRSKPSMCRNMSLVIKTRRNKDKWGFELSYGTNPVSKPSWMFHVS